MKELLNKDGQFNIIKERDSLYTVQSFPKPLTQTVVDYIKTHFNEVSRDRFGITFKI